MKAYKMRYNEDSKMFEYMEFNIKNQYDFSNDPDTNFNEAVDSHSINLESIKSYIDGLNRDIKNRIFDVLKCKDCGMIYLYGDREKQLFESLGFKPPIRCPKCRERRKREKNKDKKS